MTDVLIVGAGPAGSAAAIGLARRGHSVLLLDRSSFPREKACGEGLMPSGVAALSRLGVLVEGAPFRGVRYHHDGRSVEGTFPNGFGLGVRRLHLDAALFDVARRTSGVTAITTTVEAPILEGGQVVGVRTRDGEYRARLTVAADGANSVLRHKLGWDASTRSRRHAVVRHYRSTAPVSEWVEIHLNNGQEIYITPLPGNELLIASLGDSPALPDSLEPIGPPRGAAPLTVRATQRYAPGCVLLGDAAGNCDPITGGGIAQALLSAERLAEHVDSLETFDRAREAMLANYRRLTAGVLTLARHPALLRPALSILGRSPALFSRLLGVASGM